MISSGLALVVRPLGLALKQEQLLELELP